MTPKHKSTAAQPAPSLFLDRELLKSLVETAVQSVLDAEVERFVGAGPYERSGKRRGYRNGSKPRTMKTCVGELRFQSPQVRPESGREGFRTSVYDRYQRSEKALVATMQEMVVQGVSTRSVTDVLEQMGGFEVSAATVSRTMSELDEQIDSFFSRPLGHCEYPYLIIDARYESVRFNGRVRKQAVLIVAGVRDDGRRELLSLTLGDSESAQTWGDVFSDLKRRGLRGIEVVVSDAHQGIRAALNKHMQGVAWQRCKVHLMREMMNKVTWKDYKELAADLHSIYASDERAQCLRVAQEVAAKWERRAPKMSRALLEGVEDTLTVLDLPAKHRKRLHSTNMLERLNKTIKARTRNVGSFPNEKACRRLIGAVLLEMQDTWDSEPHRYLIMEDRATN